MSEIFLLNATYIKLKMGNNYTNIFPSHFREFIEALNNNKVEYLLIGGYALGAYGHIRSTGDLDIFVNATEENANKALSACSEDLAYLEMLKNRT